MWIFERLKEEAEKPAFLNPFFDNHRIQELKEKKEHRLQKGLGESRGVGFEFDAAIRNVSACLEATSQRNLPLYEQHGFEANGSVQVAGSPQIIAMLRKPRPMS